MSECDKCGKNFDSEKGLKIHKSQIHKGADEDKDSEGIFQVKSIKPWVLAGIVVIIGLALMIAAGEGGIGLDDEGSQESFSRDLKLVVENENTTENTTEPKEDEQGDGYPEG